MISWILSPYSVSHSCVPMIKFTGLSHLFKWEILQDHVKIIFCPTVNGMIYFRNVLRDICLWIHLNDFFVEFKNIG